MTTILYFLQKKQTDSAEYFVCLQGGGSGVVPPLTDVNATGRKITINGTLSAFAEYKISQPRVLGLR